MSGALAETGITRGDVVAVVLPNSVDLVTIMFAAWRLGATLTPVNPALTTAKSSTSSPTRARGSWSPTIPRRPKVAGGVARIWGVGELLTRGGDTNVESPRRELGDLALMIYTGGTTGRPKA